MCANKLILRLIKEEAKSFISTDKENVFIICSASKIVIEQEWCFPTKEYEFEGMKLKSFNSADCYFKRHYGADYLHFPPNEQRRVGIKKIDF